MFARNKRILVIGSPVLDRIIRKGREYKQLGGISYSLWVLGKFYPEIEVIPIMNIGEPLYKCYTQWLHSLGNVNTSYIKCKGGINRNTLIYQNSEREEYMEIGQSPVRKIPEKLLKNTDGIFINFITRNDVSIEEVKKLEWYNLPVYIDLHSFLRGVRSGKFVLSNKKNWKVIVQAASYLQIPILNGRKNHKRQIDGDSCYWSPGDFSDKRGTGYFIFYQWRNFRKNSFQNM